MSVKFYQDNQITIYNGDCRQMSELPDESIHCVVTSPPYWGLRKYEGSQELIWGGNHCEHEWGNVIEVKGHRAGETNPGKEGYTKDTEQWSSNRGGFCSLCGAWKGAFGLEPTPELYIQHTIEILREIRGVLRSDGCIFWNIGDSYAGSGSPGGDFRDGKGGDEYLRPYNRKGGPLKPKDLCLIPFHIAIAAQEDGWWIRSVIIWNKPNPMPESVTDRPTNSYEFILMLTKSKKYYWDADAVREPQTGGAHSRGTEKGNEAYQEVRGSYKGFRSPITELVAGRNLRDVWTFPTEPYSEWKSYDFDRADFIKDGIPYTISSSCPVHGDDDHRGKSISEFIDTSMVCICRPAEISHFAVFPEKLSELCIKAATSEKGCCPKCGAPWARITETSREFRSGSGRAGNKPMGKWAGQEEAKGDLEDDIRAGPCVSTKTIGWRPTCHCERSETISCIVLDPFVGTGTTLWVAKKLGRRAIGYDISEEYCKLALERNRQAVISF